MKIPDLSHLFAQSIIDQVIHDSVKHYENNPNNTQRFILGVNFLEDQATRTLKQYNSMKNLFRISNRDVKLTLKVEGWDQDGQNDRTKFQFTICETIFLNEEF